MPLDVTSLARVKDALGGVEGTSRDDFLETLITSVSQGLEDWTGVTLLSAARTEVIDVDPRTDEIYLDVRPVSVLTSVKTRISRQTDWADVTAIDSDSLTLNATSGRVIVDATLYSGRDAAQVVYTAGFAATTAAFIAAYPALASAADAQIVYEFQRATQADQGTQSAQGGVSFRQSGLEWIPLVLDRWGPYRRFHLG